MARVLLVYYSQTGQLARLAGSACAPLKEAEAEHVQWQELLLRPAHEYPFPWSFFAFFDVFPETVHLDPPPLDHTPLDPRERFDLVILAYTVWFLSPAPPMAAFVQSEAGRTLLRDTPVITLVGCRNMWLCAHDTMRELLARAGARHIDNAVVTDSHPGFATFITTPRWMLTGRQNGFWGMPEAGIAQADIDAASRFGRAIRQSLSDGSFDGKHSVLHGLEAVRVDDRMLASERIGHRSFTLWGRLVRACGPPGSKRRRPILAIYALFLVTMIVTVVPLSILIRALIRPFRREVGAAVRQRYAQPSGSGSERMAEFGP